MTTFVWVIRALLLLALCTPLDSNAKRQLKRQGSIANALQAAATASPDPLFKQNFSVASIDKFSTVEPRIKEGIFEKEKKDERLAPIAQKPIEPESTKDALEQKELTTQYELPQELQQKAKTALKAVETNHKDEEKIELQFQDADLYTFVKQIEELFSVTFLTDEAIDPLPKGTPDEPVKALKGNKITFKTNNPFSRKQAWDFFITFLDIAGFAVIPQPDPSIYRIQTNKAAQRAPLPTFIGIDYLNLPSNNQLIRYLYFIENSTIDALKNVVPALKSVEGSVIFLQEQKAFLITDKAYNIRALMEIVKELDKVSMPQAMSVLKLHQTDAEEVKKLYDELTQTKEDQSPFKPFGARKQSNAIYFPENARLIAEPRTNSLILLGPKDAIEKIEDFIVKNIDVELDQPYSPLYTYHLQYADAKNIADIMNKTTRFGANTEAAKAGGVRGTDKYMKDMVFTAEPATNKIIIKGDYEDYLIAKKIIAELDQQQPQVALDILILNIDLVDSKELGVQMRSKIPGLDGLLGQNVKFATSGLFAGSAASEIVQNPNGNGVDRLLGNILQLVSSAPAGNTIVSFGQDVFGVWGLLQMLRKITSLQVVSNPFLVTSNKTQAIVSVGEKRRVVSAEIFTGSSGDSGTQAFANDEASLKVTVTPQINQDGMVILNLRVDIVEFTDQTNQASGDKLAKKVDTQVVVADKEVLALGGLIRNIVNEGMSKTPILGDIPLLGWFFKNQRKNDTKSSLLILVQSKIIPANNLEQVNEFTREHMENYRVGMQSLESTSDKKDPIHRMFFAQQNGTENLGEFLFDRNQKNKRRRGRKRNDPIEDPTALNFTQAIPQQSFDIATPSAPHTILAQTTPTIDPVKNAFNITPKSKHRRGASLSSMLTSEKTV